MQRLPAGVSHDPQSSQGSSVTTRRGKRGKCNPTSELKSILLSVVFCLLGNVDGPIRPRSARANAANWQTTHTSSPPWSSFPFLLCSSLRQGKKCPFLERARKDVNQCLSCRNTQLWAYKGVKRTVFEARLAVEHEHQKYMLVVFCWEDRYTVEHSALYVVSREC